MGFEVVGLIVGIVAAIAGAAVAGVQSTQAKQAADDNLAMQKENYQYNKELQQQIFEREDSAYQRKVADLQKAGLNTQLALGGGSPSGNVVATSAPQLDMSSYISAGSKSYDSIMNIGREAMGLVPHFQEAKKKKEEIRHAAVSNVYSEIVEFWKAANTEKYSSGMIEAEKERLLSEIRKNLTGADLNEAESYLTRSFKTMLIEAQTRETNARTEKTVAETEKITVDTQNARQDLLKKLATFEYDKVLAQIRVQMAQNELTISDLNKVSQQIRNDMDLTDAELKRKYGGAEKFADIVHTWTSSLRDLSISAKFGVEAYRELTKGLPPAKSFSEDVVQEHYNAKGKLKGKTLTRRSNKEKWSQ